MSKIQRQRKTQIDMRGLVTLGSWKKLQASRTAAGTTGSIMHMWYSHALLKCAMTNQGQRVLRKGSKIKGRYKKRRSWGLRRWNAICLEKWALGFACVLDVHKKKHKCAREKGGYLSPFLSIYPLSEPHFLFITYDIWRWCESDTITKKERRKRRRRRRQRSWPWRDREI